MIIDIQLDKFALFIAYLLLGLSGLYIFVTKKTTDIIVRKKLTIVSWGFTKYLVIDSNSKIYEISNNLWFGIKSDLDDWVNIKLNKKYTISYYGIDNKFLGLKPQIVDFNE